MRTIWPDETARVILRGTDLIALPYRSTGRIDQRRLRFVLPLERPVIVTDEPIFADARESLMVVDASSRAGSRTRSDASSWTASSKSPWR